MNKPLLLFATQCNNPGYTGLLPNGTILNVDNAGNIVYQFIKTILHIKKLIIQFAFKIDEDGTNQTIGSGARQALKTYFFNIFDCTLNIELYDSTAGQIYFLKQINFPLHLIIPPSFVMGNKQESYTFKKDDVTIRQSLKYIRNSGGVYFLIPYYEIEIDDFLLPCDFFLNGNAPRYSFRFSYDIHNNKQPSSFFMDSFGWQIAAYGITE